MGATITILLAGCGDGGSTPTVSSVGSPPIPINPPPIIMTQGDLQATVPDLAYPADSEEFSFVTAVNQFRQRIGLGLLAQNLLLDKSAQNHLQYVLKNDALNGGSVNMRTNDPGTGRSMFHIENAANPLFTGVLELDRAKAAGYAGNYVGEELTFAGGKGAKIALDSLTRTIYHRAGLMFQGVREIGVAVGADPSQTFTLEFGYNKAQSNASDFIGVYPVHDQTAVGRFAGVEVPNPFPELSTSTDDFPTKTGYPISVASQENTRLEVLTFTITEMGAASPLDSRLLTRDNDPNQLLGSNVAFLVAKSTLKANTAYSVIFSGRVNNSIVKQSWKFTTGS